MQQDLDPRPFSGDQEVVGSRADLADVSAASATGDTHPQPGLGTPLDVLAAVGLGGDEQSLATVASNGTIQVD